MISFSDWRKKQDESSAFTRARQQAALGLGPDIPDAAIHSRSTAAPWMVDKLTKKKKKKKSKAKKKKLTEAKKTPSKNNQIDLFLKGVADIKANIKDIKDKAKKSKPEDKKPVEKKPESKVKVGQKPKCKKKPN